LTDGADAVTVRSRASRRDAEGAALVLAALGIPHRLEPAPDGWQVLVAPEDGARAAEALDDVARERRVPAADAPTRPVTLAGVHVAVLLAALYLWTGPRVARSPAFAAGEADARVILEGAWWRAVTALTLHADGPHLAGNALFAAVFVGALGAVVGTGTAIWVTLAAGTAGNLLNAWLRAPLHHVVGASTAVFGAVGALSGAAFAGRRGTRDAARAWLALGAGLALLAMLGSSAESDVGAHLLGFAAGVPLGAVATRLPRGGAGMQVGLAVLALAAVAAAWVLARG
jgi:membrane associated rhomboid family serine protease